MSLVMITATFSMLVALSPSAELTPGDAVFVYSSQEVAMADNKNPNEKQPGENKPGKYHFNPGNQAGKTAEKTVKPASEQVNNPDRIDSRKEKQG